MYQQIITKFTSALEKLQISIETTAIVEHCLLKLACPHITTLPEKCSFAKLDAKYMFFSYSDLNDEAVKALTNYIRQFDKQAFYYYSSEKKSHCYVINTTIFYGQIMPRLIDAFSKIDAQALKTYQQQTEDAIEEEKQSKSMNKAQARKLLVTLGQLEERINLLTASEMTIYDSRYSNPLATIRQGLESHEPLMNQVFQGYQDIVDLISVNQKLHNDCQIKDLLNTMADFCQPYYIYIPSKRNDLLIAHRQYREHIEKHSGKNDGFLRSNANLSAKTYDGEESVIHAGHSPEMTTRYTAP